MLTEDAIRLIISFLGGGLIAGLLNLWGTNRLDRKRKRIEYLRIQLQELYGPLRFFTSANDQLFKLHRKFQDAYTTEFIDKRWSDNPLTQERLGNWTTETINLSNSYIKQVVENNGRILEILTNHYSLIESTDAEIIAQFFVDYIRHKTEISEGTLKTPMAIYNLVGEVSFMHPEFIEVVDKRFNEKQAELKQLLR